MDSAGDAIRVNDLEKSFGDTPVLWGLNLTVGWGEFVVLVGANGVGKSTLLRILSTQSRADAGSALVSGYDVRRQPGAVRRVVGVVGHDTFLYDDLTCLENLTYYGRLFALKEPGQRAEEMLSRLGLSRHANQRLRTLSHGMQKRVAIARAILHQPRILLLDEPESGLDQGSVAGLQSTLGEWTASGRTVIMTTHNTGLALSWSDRVGVLSGGKLHFCGYGESPMDAEFQQLLATSLGAGR